MFGVHVLVLKAMEMRKTEMTFSYYHLFKEMVYNAGETDIQGITRVETYDDPPITSRCRFLYTLELNSNSMAHKDISFERKRSTFDYCTQFVLSWDSLNDNVAIRIPSLKIY